LIEEDDKIQSIDDADLDEQGFIKNEID